MNGRLRPSKVTRRKDGRKGQDDQGRLRAALHVHVRRLFEGGDSHLLRRPTICRLRRSHSAQGLRFDPAPTPHTASRPQPTAAAANPRLSRRLTDGAGPALDNCEPNLSRTDALLMSDALPKTTKELLNLLGMCRTEIQKLIDGGQFGYIYQPTMLGKDIALALESMMGDVPARARPGSRAVRRVVLAAWHLDYYADLGNRPKLTEAFNHFLGHGRCDNSLWRLNARTRQAGVRRHRGNSRGGRSRDARGASPRTTEAHKGITSKYNYNVHIFPILRERAAVPFRRRTPPMSLADWMKAVPWAESARENFISEKMPPWFADPKVRRSGAVNAHDEGARHAPQLGWRGHAARDEKSFVFGDGRRVSRRPTRARPMIGWPARPT